MFRLDEYTDLKPINPCPDLSHRVGMFDINIQLFDEHPYEMLLVMRHFLILHIHDTDIRRKSRRMTALSPLFDPHVSDMPIPLYRIAIDDTGKVRAGDTGRTRAESGPRRVIRIRQQDGEVVSNERTANGGD